MSATDTVLYSGLSLTDALRALQMGMKLAELLTAPEPVDTVISITFSEGDSER